MQRFKVENQIQFADILKQSVEGFNEDLDQVEQCEGGLSGRGDHDEVEGCIVAVCDEGGGVVVGLGGGCRGGGSCS